jgi:hypothetical protein
MLSTGGSLPNQRMQLTARQVQGTLDSAGAAK